MFGKCFVVSAPSSRILLLALCLAGCAESTLPLHELSGSAMGTSYNVKVVEMPPSVDRSALEQAVHDRIRAIDARMTTYRPESELSRFNTSAQTDWFAVSAELCAVVSDALALGELTHGAFDVTVGPLVNLWGFGAADADASPPHDARIDELLASVGYQKLEADCSRPALRKQVPGVYVDLSAYAKGRAVDAVAELLEHEGVANYLVEIGGELRLRGHNARGNDWAVAIETPRLAGRSVQSVASLSDVAIATSGDYRNYFEYDGVRYSHTIDPRTGRPVNHDGASVTVVTDSAGLADAMATALLVLGPDDGLRFAEREDLAAYFLLRVDGEIQERSSARFRTEVALR